MSYILDALKKSQRQRELGQVPTLGAEHSQHPSRTPAPALVLLAAGLGGALLTGATLYLLLRPGTEPAAPVQEARAPSTPQPPPKGNLPPRVYPPSSKPAVVPYVEQPVKPPIQLQPDEPPLAVTTIPPLETAPPPATLLSSGDVPYWSELPERQRATVPDLQLNVHVYADNPAARFIFINNTLYREGQTTHEGAIVEAITPEGAVLRYGDIRFKTAL